MFDEKQKNYVKRIHLVTDGGLYDRKTFYKVKIVFIHPSSERLLTRFDNELAINLAPSINCNM